MWPAAGPPPARPAEPGAAAAPCPYLQRRPIERHKGGPFPPPRMGGSEPGAAAEVWKAAGDAWAWAATIREHTAWSASEQGWSAKAESDDALRRVAESASEPSAAHGAPGAEELGRAATAMRRVVVRMGLASRLFDRSSRFNGAAARHLRRATKAYERAGAKGPAKDVKARLKMAGEYIETAAKQSAEVDRMAKSFAPFADVLAMAAAAPADAGRGAAPDVASMRSELLAVAGRDRKTSTDMTGRAGKAVQLTAMARELTGAAAKESADDTARARAKPGAKKAAAAWKRAMAAADRAAADDERIRKKIKGGARGSGSGSGDQKA